VTKTAAATEAARKVRRRAHRGDIVQMLALVRAKQRTTRAIAELAEVNLATVQDWMHDLEAVGIVTREHRMQGKKGRPVIEWKWLGGVA
jgi:predicted transcriptional regulator